MPKRKPSAGESPSFEEALAELESIVAAMDHESLPLEKLVEYYEHGSRLLARCESVLHSARQRLETISLHSKPDESADEPADESAADSPAEPAPGPDSDTDDIRLF